MRREFGRKIAEKLMLLPEVSLVTEANVLNSKDELAVFLKEQIKIENKIVESLNSALEKIGNPQRSCAPS